VLHIHFNATNMAKYEALMHDLVTAKDLGIMQIQCFGDSDLAQQVSGLWDAKDPHVAS
jgi:ribonuclease HI